MRIKELLWSRDRIEHIARHSVTPDEVEEVCFGQSLVLRAKSQCENAVYLRAWAKPKPAGIYFQSSFSFRTAEGIL
jgi:hypothetical protein